MVIVLSSKLFEGPAAILLAAVFLSMVVVQYQHLSFRRRIGFLSVFSSMVLAAVRVSVGKSARSLSGP